MIVAAAIRHPDGRVFALPAPARHGDIIRWIVQNGIAERVPGEWEQGFVDSSDGFVDRKVALMLAHVSGQPFRDPKIYADELFSENLW